MQEFIRFLSQGWVGTIVGAGGVLALFTVGDVYAFLCKRGAYAPFTAQRRLRALF